MSSATHQPTLLMGCTLGEATSTARVTFIPSQCAGKSNCRGSRDELSLFRTGDEYVVTGRSLIVFALGDKGETIRMVRQLALELSQSKQLAL